MPAKRSVRILRTVVLDLLLAGLVLVVFALFHHVLPRDAGYQGETLPTLTPTQPAIGPSASPSAQPSSSPSPTSAVSPTPMPTVFTDRSYVSSTLTLTITMFHLEGATGYIADLRIADPLALRTAFAGGDYAPGVNGWPVDIAEKAGALLSITGDYYGIRSNGVVVRNGILYRSTLYRDVLVMYRDGTMKTFSKQEFDLEAMKTAGAWQAWSFGPMLLKDGLPMTAFDSDVPARNPRSAIGYYEPGHYCLVVVDGRQPGYSDGLTLAQMSRLFYDLGCTVAYNLDGGQTAAMVFRGEIVNRPYNGGRRTSDIVFCAEPPG